jgi:hypothetical protein
MNRKRRKKRKTKEGYTVETGGTVYTSGCAAKGFISSKQCSKVQPNVIDRHAVEPTVGSKLLQAAASKLHNCKQQGCDAAALWCAPYVFNTAMHGLITTASRVNCARVASAHCEVAVLAVDAALWTKAANFTRLH